MTGSPSASFASLPAREAMHAPMVSARAHASVDPVPPFGRGEIRPCEHVLEHATILLDRPDRSDIVIVARHQHARDAKAPVCDLERSAKHRGRVALSPELGNHDESDVAADAQEELV